MNTTPVLPDQQMRDLGFTDHRPGFWYIATRAADGVTINFTINKVTGAWDELVMDEDYGQPFYYGRSSEPYRSTVHTAVNTEVARLNAAGLTVEVDHSEYLFAA